MFSALSNAAEAVASAFRINNPRNIKQNSGQSLSFPISLGELLKNSLGHLHDLKLPADQRVAAVIINTKSRKAQVWDVGGMWSELVHGNYLEYCGLNDTGWSGRGSGGKNSQFRVHNSYSLFDTYHEGIRNCLLFQKDNYEPVHPKNEAGEALKDHPEENPLGIVENYLNEVGMTLDELPEYLRTLLHKNWTVSHFDTVSEWETNQLTRSSIKSLVKQYPLLLQLDAQIDKGLSLCTTYYIVDGKVVTVLKPFPLKPFRDIPVYKEELPDQLPNPSSNSPINIKKVEGDYILEINTSKARLTGKLESRNAIRVEDARGRVVTELPISDYVKGAASCHMYGTLTFPAFDEEQWVGSDWKKIAETLDFKATKAYLSIPLNIVAKKVDKLLSNEKLNKNPEELSKHSQQINEVLNKFFEESREMGSGSGQGDEDGEGDDSKQPLPSHKMVIEPGVNTIIIAAGTSVKPSVTCLAKNEKGQDVKTKYIPKNIAGMTPKDSTLSFEKGYLSATEAGSYQLQLMDMETEAVSNIIKVAVIDCTGVSFQLPPELPRRGSHDLRPIFHTKEQDYHTGSGMRLLVESEVSHPDMIAISRFGTIAVKDIPGKCQGKIWYSNRDSETFDVTISEKVVNLSKPPVKKSGGVFNFKYVGEKMPDGGTDHGDPMMEPIIQNKPPYRQVDWINFLNKHSASVIERAETEDWKDDPMWKFYNEEQIYMVVKDRKAMELIYKKLPDGARLFEEADLLEARGEAEVLCYPLRQMLRDVL